MPYLSHHVATVCSALLFLALSLAQGGCSPARHASPAEGALSLTILHTNDIHSHIAGINKYGNACFDDADCRGGLARIATAIRTAKSRSDNVIALDAGDQFQGTLFYSVNKWPMLAELDQHMPYDAMTLGNHEFDEGCLELTRFLAALPFPVLAANLKPAKGCPMLEGNYAPYTLLTVRGQKVAVVGIANNEVVSLAAACPRTFFEDTAACLQRTVRDLEAQGVKHIIALTHIGLPEDRKLARSVDGVDIIKKVRTWSNTPIIVISARSEDHDKVEALDAGADDYLTKPFSVEELLARLRVSLRRVRYDSEKVDEAASIYQNGGLKIDYAAGCTYQNGKEIHLTPIEYKLLCLLAQNTGKVLTHNYILNKIWSSALPSDTPSLRVFMATLRKKIEPDPSHPRYIQTHIGVGYRMIRQPDEEAGAESEA